MVQTDLTNGEFRVNSLPGRYYRQPDYNSLNINPYAVGPFVDVNTMRPTLVGMLFTRLGMSMIDAQNCALKVHTIIKTEAKVHVVVSDGKSSPIILEDDELLFPSDMLVCQFRMMLTNTGK